MGFGGGGWGFRVGSSWLRIYFRKMVKGGVILSRGFKFLIYVVSFRWIFFTKFKFNDKIIKLRIGFFEYGILFDCIGCMFYEVDFV